MLTKTKKITALGASATLALAVSFFASCASVGAVTCSPASSASPCSVSIPVNVTVSDTISLSVASGSEEVAVELDPGETRPSTTHTAKATSTLSVSTNALSGWTLSVADYDTDNALKYVVGGVTKATIPAGSTSTAFNLSAGTAAWGIRGVSSAGTLSLDTSKFIGVPALSSAINWSTAFVPSTNKSVIYTNERNTKLGITPLTVASHSNLSTSAKNETTVVEYGVATANNQAAGTYTDTIVYMATVNV